ncbi:peptidase U34 [Palaeococcus pacificus DY20341]|uniref:Peptidase U34 n=1 Tax=Palaeococcus pacificus DY20341 TaxID=1343739 RepID=A0A075LU20_9EURY|nr:C69 family dipeptidase [Palaeococcus pacificus]AIF69606.1 peptidase U34 [Palaeococcus pacificus DY20341]
MCDVLIATPSATKNREMIFAKNSDREPNEAQILEFIPRKKHEAEKVKLTYVEFPQVRETYAVLLSRPWWMWGAEMGANEFGLTIGNTAVFTKIKVPKTGILGMDMIRLALERTKTSREALEFVISLIENYGQGGNGSYGHKLLYHNSFIIADPKEAWVLETAGKHWVAKKVEGVYSISNALTIEDDWDLASESVERLAKERKGFSFAKYFSDKFYTHFAHGRERRAFTYKKLKEKEGEITLEYMMQILRSHQREPFEPANGSMRDICMHYGGLTRPSQTASSQISELGRINVHWFTGTSLPCLSLFKPVYIEAGLPKLGDEPTNEFNPKSYWWRFEAFHRKFQTSYKEHIEEFSRDIAEIQKELIENEKEIRGKASKEELLALTLSAFEEEAKLLEMWESKVGIKKLPLLYGRVWKKVNAKAKLKF